MKQLIPWWPVVRDGRWTLDVALVAGAVYKGALAAGFREERARGCAEAAGYKELYGGLLYPEELERDLRAIREGAG